MSSWAQEIDALYAGDPGAFVAGRDALARAVRTAGERDTAAAIKGLRRPSLGAWYANVAARASLVSLYEWLTLGARLREAQARLDLRQVGELGAGRAALEERVVRDLAAHLAALGVTASPAGLEEFRGTLRAALADPAAGDALASGRLERSLSYAGFGEVDVSAALAALASRLPGTAPDTAGTDDWGPGAVVEGGRPHEPAQGTGLRPKRGVPDEAPREDPVRREAEARRDRARAALTALDTRVADALRGTAAATQARSRASDAVESAERALRSAQDRLQAAAEALGDATAGLDEAQAAERAAVEERGRAQAELRAAEHALEAAP